MMQLVMAAFIVGFAFIGSLKYLDHKIAIRILLTMIGMVLAIGVGAMA